MRKTYCDNCKHLIKLRQEGAYAICPKNGWVFKDYKVDTWKSVCGYWEAKPEVELKELTEEEQAKLLEEEALKIKKEKLEARIEASNKTALETKAKILEQVEVAKNNDPNKNKSNCVDCKKCAASKDGFGYTRFMCSERKGPCLSIGVCDKFERK